MSKSCIIRSKKKEFYETGSKEVPKAIRAMGLLQKAVDILESIKPLRAQEKIGALESRL